MFDLVIKDAEIFDGAGSAPVRGDLGVTAGKIAAVGGKLGAEGLEVLATEVAARKKDPYGAVREVLAKAGL